MKGTRDLFFSTADEDDIVAVFQVGEVEDVFAGRFSGEVFEEDIVAVCRGYNVVKMGGGVRRGGIVRLPG